MEAEKKTEERKKTAALELLKHILDIPSVNGKDREQRVADYLAEYLRGKGMETTVQLIDEHHGNLIGVPIRRYARNRMDVFMQEEPAI